MPVILTSAYVNMQTVMNLIRALANDMIYSQAGEILTDTAFFTLPLINDALEWFQNEISNHGDASFTKETYLSGVTVVGVNDPGVQVNISDTGYFDGVVAAATPQLPPDLLQPLMMWERLSGSIDIWDEMRQCLDGLPSISQGQLLGMWEWRQDAIYMPGATQAQELRLRYDGAQAAFATAQDTLYYRGATGAIAYKMLSSYMASRNPDLAKMANGEAYSRLSQLITRNSRMQQRAPVTRGSYGGSGGGTPWFPPRNP